MDQKKYEIDVSACNNFYINIIKELGLQDILDIKKIYPDISLYDLFNTVELINEAYKETGEKNFIIYGQKNKDKPDKIDYLSNNCFISINKDERIATMKINPNGNLENIQKEINKTGIIYGIMTEIIESMKKDKIKNTFIFAIGDNPIPIEEAKYTFFYETKRPFPVNLQQGTKGVYFDTTLENRTILGQTIAKLNKASVGISGKTITGLTIPTRIKPRKPISIGKNVYEINSEIKPEINGIVNYSSELVEVIPTLIFKEPLLNQNIEFDGTVIIENMVQGSTIKATHDITIYGTSNSATLIADGYIYLLTGFVGNSSKAIAKQGIFCGYAHNSKLTTLDGDIHIGYESLHATLDSGRSIYIEKKASGGKLSAKENIIMESSGAGRITTKTDLIINYDANKKNVSTLALIQEIKSTERKYQNATKELARFETTSEKPRNMVIKDHAFQHLTSMVFELQELLKEQLYLLSKNPLTDEDLDKPTRIGTVLIKDKAWNGTSITINSENFLVDKNANQGSLFRLGSYGIIRERYENETVI